MNKTKRILLSELLNQYKEELQYKKLITEKAEKSLYEESIKIMQFLNSTFSRIAIQNKNVDRIAFHSSYISGEKIIKSKHILISLNANNDKQAHIRFFLWKEQIPNYKNVVIKTLLKLGYKIINNNIVNKENPNIKGQFKFNQSPVSARKAGKNHKGVEIVTEVYGDIILRNIKS